MIHRKSMINNFKRYPSRFILSILFSCSVILLFAQDDDRYSELDIAFQDAFLAAKNNAILGNKEKAITGFKELYKKHRTEASISMELAKLYESSGNLENAILYAEKAVEADSKNQWYVTFLAERYEENQDYKRAITTYGRLLELDNKNVRYIYEKIAFNQLMAAKPEAALQTLSDLEKITGIEEEISRKKYDTYLAMGQNKLAVAELKKLSDAFPKETRYLRNLAIEYQKENNTQEAIAVLEKLTGLDEEDAEAQLLLNKLTTPDGNNSLSSLAVYIDSRDHPIKLKIAELIPHIENLSSTNNSSEYEELLSILENLKQKHPSEAAAFAITGDAWYNLGEYDQAIANYEETIKIDDKKYSVWAQLMEAYYLKENYKTLKQVSENGMDFFPNQALSYIFYAKASTALKEYDIASDYLEEAELIAGGSDKIVNHIKLARADNFIRKGSKKEGKELLSQLSTGNAAIHVAHLEYLGDIYFRAGMQEQAMKSWKTAAKGPYQNVVLLDKIANKSL